MGIVTYVGPFPTAEVDNHGQKAIAQKGVQYTLPDDVCAALLAEDPGWWQAGDQHTATLIQTPNAVVVTVTAAYVIQPLVALCLADATGGAFAVSLPDATTAAGRRLEIRASNANTNLVTLNCAVVGQTISNVASVQLGQGQTFQGVAVISDGANWHITDAVNVTSGAGFAQYATTGTFTQPLTMSGGLTLQPSSTATAPLTLKGASGGGQVTYATVREGSTGTEFFRLENISGSVGFGAPLTLYAGTNGGNAAGIDVAATIPFRDMVPYSKTLSHLEQVSLGGATSGTWTWTWGGQTATLNQSDTAAQVQTKLQALSSIGTNNVRVEATTGGYYIFFAGALATASQAVATASFAGLVGATGPSLTQLQAGGQVNDQLYISDNGALAPTFGFGLPQPPNDMKVNIQPDTSNPALGGLRIRQSTGNTGYPLLVETFGLAALLRADVNGNVLIRNSLQIFGGASTVGAVVYSQQLFADTQPRLQFLGDGSIQWGSGAATPDVTLNRNGTAQLNLTATQLNFNGNLKFLEAATSNNIFTALIAGDTNNRFAATTLGTLQWGGGSSGADCTLVRNSASYMQWSGCHVGIASVGKGLRVAEGSNAKQGVATLVAGTVVVANTAVTASSRIQLTAQDASSTGALYVSARTAATSFTIQSSNAADAGVVAYEIFEPA